MDIDIDKIDTYEIRNKVNTIKWRPIYEVIEEDYLIESEKFSNDFMQQCKKMQIMLNLSHLCTL